MRDSAERGGLFPAEELQKFILAHRGRSMKGV
jgi:hypothetical protein